MCGHESSQVQLVELAAVVRSHGLRGELLLKSFNPESTLLGEVERVLLKARDGALRELEVCAVRQHAEHLLVSLRGVETREQADALRGQLVCVTRAQLPPLAEGEYYLMDLVGLRVCARDGSELGRVDALIEYPSVACLVVPGADGVREVPNLPRYVLEVDLPGRRVVVDHLEEIEPAQPARKRGDPR
jgi:16S rRNA processing protein RimM